MHPLEELADYRRKVAELYQSVRQSGGNPQTHRRFCEQRDHLFATHPQSALDQEQKRVFKGLAYFDYNPALRFIVPIDDQVESEVLEVELSEDGRVRLQRFGRVHFEVGGQLQSLSLFWILGYGGGIFLPFRDATSGAETYGGGRYLLDTIKHADLGYEAGNLVLDFNFAYNPSCAYNPRWSCPLAPLENRLRVPIRAGEKAFA